MQPHRESKTILVVDDDFSVLTVIKSMLELTPYNIAIARTADVAQSIAERRDVIDLLLLDVVMPDVRGPDLAENILKIQPNAKVLFMSGYAESHVINQNVSTVGFLPKPFTSRSLRDAIDAALSVAIQTASSTNSAF